MLGITWTPRAEHVSTLLFSTSHLTKKTEVELLFTIQQLAGNDRQWKQDAPFCILDTDVAKVYENVSFGLTARSPREKEAPKFVRIPGAPCGKLS